MHQCYAFASRVKAKRIYVQKFNLKYPASSDPLATLPFKKPWDPDSRPIRVEVKTQNKRARCDNQPTPRHDYINFKRMSGNEILLNLDNYENLSNSEIVSGLLELGKRDPGNEHDWNYHPITYKCIRDFKERAHAFNYKHILQMAVALDRLHITDQQAWQKSAQHFLRMLHKYKGRHFATMLDLYDKEFLDKEGESYIKFKKYNDPAFFERIVALLPMHIPFLNASELIRTLEVLVRRNLGSERLFNNYIYLRIERNVLKYSVRNYCRMIRAIADKQFTEDPVFWNDYVFKYIKVGRNGVEGNRKFTPTEAKHVWEAIIYLKLRCPQINLRDTLSHVEKWME